MWMYLAVLGLIALFVFIRYVLGRRARVKEGERKKPTALDILNPPIDPTKSPNPERTQERLAWFDKAAGNALKVTLRPPPVPKGPIMTVKGELIPCPGCSRPGGCKIAPTAFPAPLTPGSIVSREVRYPYRCGACKDRGYIFMQYN